VEAFGKHMFTGDFCLQWGVTKSSSRVPDTMIVHGRATNLDHPRVIGQRNCGAGAELKTHPRKWRHPPELAAGGSAGKKLSQNHTQN